jgi:hypothetical protein
LFDSSKVGLKAVFLPTGKKFPSVPLDHAVNRTESCENIKLLLKRSGKNNIIGTFVGI